MGDINAFPLLQLTSCTNPLSKISPGYFPPYRKRQEMTVEFGSEAALSPEPAEREQVLSEGGL